VRFKPTKENLIEWRDAGMSLNDMKEICGYSKASLSQFFDEYGLKNLNLEESEDLRFQKKQKES